MVEKTASKKKNETPKYGVLELSKMLKLKPSTTRVKLRQAKVKRSGRGYGWGSESEMKAVSKKLVATA